MGTIFFIGSALISLIFLYYYHLHQTVVNISETLLKEHPADQLVQVISPSDKKPMMILIILGVVGSIIFLTETKYDEIILSTFLITVCAGSPFYPSFLESHFKARIRNKLAKRLGVFVKDNDLKMIENAHQLIRVIDETKVTL